MSPTIRRVDSMSPVYEVRTPAGTLRLRPSELCAFAESLERWFRGHRGQLVDDLVEESVGPGSVPFRRTHMTSAASPN